MRKEISPHLFFTVFVFVITELELLAVIYFFMESCEKTKQDINCQE